MRKIICFLLILALCAPAMAEGFLPSLDDIYGVTMPSVRAVLDRDPDKEETLSDGAVRCTFEEVTEEDYEAIREYFADYGCTYDDYEVHGTSFDVDVKKGSKFFAFTYDYLSETVTVCYPAGANEEEAEISPPVSVGDVIQFGTYPQTKSGNDETPIDWIVLAYEHDKALVISKYALDCMQYNTTNMNVTWETCSLRSWLNNEFYNKAFNTEEKQYIISSKVTADRNPSVNTNPGNDTTDNVFLLSIEEAEKYFANNASRMCVPTDYAVKNGAYTNSNFGVDGRTCSWWWLRSPGNGNYHASYVMYWGSIFFDGYYVDRSDRSIRPCMWIRLKK